MKYLLFFLFLLFISCSNEVRFIEDYISGSWAIDDAMFSDTIEHTPFSNILNFAEDYTGSAHIFEPKDFKWEVFEKESGEFILSIESKSQKVDFLIIFDRNTEKRLFVMYLLSDYANLECTKLFNSYEKNAPKLQRAMSITKEKNVQ